MVEELRLRYVEAGFKPVKYPIRVLEDDGVNNYIYKLQRQYEFQISGWVSMALESVVDGIAYATVHRECKIG